MMVLVTGPADSGKSELAEGLAVNLAAGLPIDQAVSMTSDQTEYRCNNLPKYYIATMIPYGAQGAARVEKHRKLREGKGFITLERPDSMSEVAKELLEAGGNGNFSKTAVKGVCLLECMANLAGNEMHRPEHAGLDLDTLVRIILDSVMELEKAVAVLVVVTEEFPTDAPGYDDDTRTYAMLLNRLNSALSERADRVFQKCRPASDIFAGDRW